MQTYLAFAGLSSVEFQGTLPTVLCVLFLLAFEARAIDIAHLHCLDTRQFYFHQRLVCDGQLPWYRLGGLGAGDGRHGFVCSTVVERQACGCWGGHGLLLDEGGLCLDRRLGVCAGGHDGG